MAIEGVSLNETAIRKAEARADALDIDLQDLSDAMRTAHPPGLANTKNGVAFWNRFRFLRVAVMFYDE